jgi:type I restriction enzyme, R subunit
VPLPREVEQYLHYFCGDAANPNALNETEALRVSFYKAVATSCAPLPTSRRTSPRPGTPTPRRRAAEGSRVLREIRAAIKKHSGEELDIKPYEADMRHLINTYIQADPAADLGELGEMSLTELIIETGIHDAIARKLNEKGKLSKNAIAEGIINNVRKTIIRDQLTDPRFYEQMSKLLDDLIKQSRADAAAYEEFLRKAEALVKRLAAKQPEAGIPAALHGKREATVIYNNLPRSSRGATSFRAVPTPTRTRRLKLALEIDRVMREQARRAGRATRRARRRC